MEKGIFKSFVPKIKEISLPGAAAHQTMAPPQRIALMKMALAQEAPSKQAAVIICCYRKSDGLVYFPLIKRSKYPGVHSGQMALPGGKKEATDVDLWHTAKREFQEELGVFNLSPQKICPLSPIYIPPSHFWVTPYIGLLDETPQFAPQKREVATVFEMSFNTLNSLKKNSRNMVNGSNYTVGNVPVYSYMGETIWGATAMILAEFKMILAKWNEI